MILSLLLFTSINIYSILGDVVITNGEVVLGVNEYADLNVPYSAVADCPTYDPLSIGQIGLRTKDCEYASTEPGCQCEGWGLRVGNIGLGMSANQDVGGYDNVYPVSETPTGSDTVEVVNRDGGNIVLVTHLFKPSVSKYAFEVEVTIENTDPAKRTFSETYYRRAMDWDITPTHFREYVTIINSIGAGISGSMLKFSSDNGFCDTNPKDTPNCGTIRPECLNLDCVDSGPADHGAVFDFDLGPLDYGKTVSFSIFYGVADGETGDEGALRALYDIGAEVASLGQNSATDPKTGLPHTFFFGFSGIDGEVIDDGCITSLAYNVQFLIDESGSVRSAGYTQSINLVRRLIEDDISKDAPISLFEFSADVDVIYLFSQTQNPRDDMIAALGGSTFDGSTTNTRMVIETGIAEWERALAANELVDGQKILFLLTDGAPWPPGTATNPCPVAGAAGPYKEKLDDLDVKVIILAVGSFATGNIECLVRNPRDQLIEVTDFSEAAFDEIEEELTKVTCPPPTETVIVGPEPKTCREAQKYCKEVIGTSLATIRTREDRDAAIDALEEAGENSDGVWIGLYSDDVETKWQWRSDEDCLSPSAYKCVDFWLEAPGGEENRPRCIGPSEKGSQCAAFYADLDGVNNDIPINIERPFLCDV